MTTISRLIMFSTRSRGRFCSKIINIHQKSLKKRFLFRNSYGMLFVDKKDALVDEEINIQVSGLRPYAETTIRATCMTECKNNTMFQSFAHYKADSNGCISLKKDPSLYGTYTGVDPMGLFWSKVPLENEGKTERLLSLKDPSRPLKTNLQLYEGFHNFNHTTLADTTTFCKDLTLKNSLTFNRWFMANDKVEQEEVKAGRLRGFVYYPKTSGKFKGIIDLYGSGGGIYPARAALLASHGFTTFSLAYLGYDDLPSEMRSLEIEYFEEAVEWFLNHEKVKPDGVGIMAISYGVQFALLLASRQSRVKAVICINGPDFISTSPVNADGNPLKHVSVSVEKAGRNKEGHIMIRDAHPRDIDEEALIPVDKIQSKLLLLVSGNDTNFVSDIAAERLLRRLRENGKEQQCKMVVYPGAGHVIEPSYLPHCTQLYNRMIGGIAAWGGITKFHAAAQKDAWGRTLQFFQDHL